jgi:hypothetical protein
VKEDQNRFSSESFSFTSAILFCASETQCLSLEKEYALRICENITLRKIFGSERKEITGG